MNPLLSPWTTPFELPPFAEISDADFAPAFEAAMAQARARVQAIADNPEPPSFGNTIEALARLSDDGFRYLVIDRESYAPETWRRVKDILWAHRLDMSNEHDGYILVDLSVRKDEPASNEAIAAGE